MIKQNCLYSQGHLHGKVVDGSFVPEPTPSHSDHVSAASAGRYIEICDI